MSTRPYIETGDAAQAAAQPLPAVGQRWTMRPERGTRTVTITRVWDLGDGYGPAVAFEWHDSGPGVAGSACPLSVFLAAYEPEQAPVFHRDATLDTIRGALDAYFDEVDPEDTDTDDLAETVLSALERAAAKGGGA